MPKADTVSTEIKVEEKTITSKAKVSISGDILNLKPKGDKSEIDKRVN